MKILIVFCSRFGSTSEIILKIAETIRNSGHINNIRNLKGISEEDIPDLTQYDGIIIGTGIKMGLWTNEVSKFLSNYSSILKTTQIPLAIFVTSGLESNPANYELTKKMYLTDKIDKDLNILKLDVFAGVLDLTKYSPFNWIERRIILRMKSEIPQIQRNRKNDFRNWSKIKGFTTEFLLKIQEFQNQKVLNVLR